MERTPDQHSFEADPFAKPGRDLPIAEPDPWGFLPEAEVIPESTDDGREAYLRWRDGVTSSAGVPVPDTSKPPTIASRMWASVQSRLRFVQSRLRFDRRVVAGLGLFAAACALLVGVSRYDLGASIKTVSGATYDTAVGGLGSAVSAARDLVGQGPVGPATTEDVASISSNTAPTARPTTERRGAINSSGALYRIPHISPETVRANGPAPVGNANVTATMETHETPALPQVDSDVDRSIVYSPQDADVSPPETIRSPGIATEGVGAEKHILLIDVLVSETGDVESARGRPRPATISAALQYTMAQSVVMTWRFSPARKDGQPVKYRTTVPFVETMSVRR